MYLLFQDIANESPVDPGRLSYNKEDELFIKLFSVPITYGHMGLPSNPVAANPPADPKHIEIVISKPAAF